MPSQRIIEAFVGEHGAGKSEVALSRALWLARNGTEVALADMDTVEPCYTLNSPLTKALTRIPNLKLLTNVSERIFPGETGNVISPSVRWAIVRNQNAILDIGYGVDGYKVLRLLEGYSRLKDEVKLYFVQNFSRPATGEVDSAMRYLNTYEKLDGIINNTHLGDQSTVELAREGEEKAVELAEKVNLPIIATVVWRAIAVNYLAKLGVAEAGKAVTHSVEPVASPDEVQIDIASAVAEIEMDQGKIHPALREKFRTPIWIIARLMPLAFWLRKNLG